ncbi:hypothetical protein [Schaalia odontolytica]|uniref:hypothetical protein n=1 Tax=Schaalia odontolytica TaxID=1660 RepID=UPI0028D6EA1C|nr:hypothetical protein [Schaalia odontolytica]
MSEASRPPAQPAGPDAPDRASSITTRTPTPRLPVSRLSFLLLAGVALLAGLDASLVRLGAIAPVTSTSLGTVHGLLMIYGFLGTAICLERAVALQSDGRRAWAYAAPLLTGAGGISTGIISLNEGARTALVNLPIPRYLAAHLTGFTPERMMPGFLITLGMALLTAIYCYVWSRRQATHAVLIQLMGAIIGLGGILLWWRGLETARAVPWWLAFLIVTIIGERVELARLTFASGSTERRITAECVALMVGLTVALYSPTIGYPMIGLSLGALMADTAWHDVARGTVRMRGLPRLAAVCMLSGYGWGLVPSLMWIIAPPAFDGYGYDAGIHAITIGFVVSMLLAHAPVIIPAVARREVPYHPAMWIPFAFLQISLALRLLAGAREAAYPWRLGGTLGVVGVLLFVATTLTVTVRRAREASRERRLIDEAGASSAAGVSSSETEGR